MSDDVLIRTEGRAGRITLNRPQALNALTWEMCLEIEAALDRWRDDPAVALVIIDGAGDRAFCAGGDIAEMYRTGRAGDFDYGRRFWADEYRLNAKINAYPKPYVAFLQGFTMGGGVGVSCHGSHRIVGETSRIAMPECGIGLVPDVGGSYLLARAPGRLGEYLGLTGARMGPGDALLAGFADHFVPEAAWPDLARRLAETGEAGLIAAAGTPAPPSELAALRAQVDPAFAAATVPDILAALAGDPAPWAKTATKALLAASPLGISVALELIRRVRGCDRLEDALAMEYRVTARAGAEGDFIEGIRAAIIDKDRTPRWRHAHPDAVTRDEIDAMLAPLGADELRLGEETT